MAKTKDIIIKRKDGLYAIYRHGLLLWTVKARATHFTGTSNARKIASDLIYHDVEYIDLNRKRKGK